jgi:sec-independent protein translocase protein TatA
MGNLGFGEILLILGVAVLLFGAGRIADIGKGLGQGIRNFKQGLKEANELDEKKDEKKLPVKTVEVLPAADEKSGTPSADPPAAPAARPPSS